jgi:hypothetical protein|tara:strand:- start:73 stop:342 length:270 start_codon:yes stop_codon:yes gene_type:complete
MTEKSLLEEAQSLRAELEKARDIDEEKSYLMGDLLSEIIEHVTSDEENDVPAQKYSDDLRAEVAHFEAEHPKIAGMLERMATMLSSLGI